MSDHLQSLTLKNWLCYKKQTFKFHPGVNMIIGPTDHGKSAMMDAIHKIMENRPMGDDFQSWWSPKTSISMRFKEAIVTYKKESQAVYQIKNLVTKKITDFTAFRASVPQEITDILRMSRKINVQKQLEKKAPIFLLSESPGDVAKHLNEVANLGGIDIALMNGKQDLGSDLAEKKKIEKDIKTKEKEFATFYKLDALKIMITHAEKIQERIDKYQVTADRLEVSLLQAERVNLKLKKIRQKLKLMPMVKKALRLLDKTEIIEQKRIYYLDELAELSKYQKRRVRIQKVLTVKPIVNRGIALIQIMDQNQDDIDALQGQLSVLKFGLKRKRVIKDQLKVLQVEYKEKFPDICPLCQSVVKKERL